MGRKEDKCTEKIKFCPFCGSTDIGWVGGLAILDPHMECRGCGHRGAFLVGGLEFIKKIREEYLVREDKESQ